MPDQTVKNQIKSLLLKGFNKEEIKAMLKISEEDERAIAKITKEMSGDIDENSVELYSELQKDLSKLVFLEMQNKEKKDSTVILNAIKLQAELQEKKSLISKGSKIGITKVSKNYIYERDAEILQLKEQGIPIEEIAKKFGLNEVTIGWALDRAALNLPDHLKELSPTIITETRLLPKEDRLKFLQEAYDKKLTKMQVREIVTDIKNRTRGR